MTDNPLLKATPYIDQSYADAVPEHLRQGLADYFSKGIMPGFFLHAVLRNDFIDAILTADDMSGQALPAIGRFIYNCAPHTSTGSAVAVKSWVKRGGLNGGADK